MSALQRKNAALLAATVLAVGAILGGCGGETAGSPPAEPTPTVTATEWVEQFCVALLAAKPPSDVPSPNRVNLSDRAAVNDSLSKHIQAYDNGIGKLDKIGKSPVKSGDEGLRRIKELISKLKASMVAARDKIARLEPKDTAGVSAALKTAQDEAKAASANIGSGLDDSDLKAAAASAPTCKANKLL